MNQIRYGFLLGLGLCMLLTSSAFSQDTGTAVTALQLQEAFIKSYQQIRPQIFTVDAKGILRPQVSHEIFYLKEKQHFVIKPVGSKLEYRTGYESVPLPGGSGYADCTCAKINNDCHFEYDNPGSDEANHYFKCVGSCNCELFLDIWGVKAVSSFETTGGSWFNF